MNLFVDNLKNVKEFGFENFEVDTDKKTDRVIVKSLEDYLWLVEFDDSIDYLKENGININNLMVNECSDYIS